MGSRSDRFDFEREWPGLQERLSRTLGSWRVPRWLTDDLVQETGARMWAIRAQIDPTRSVEGLAHRIATNLLKDHLRQQKHLAPGGDLLAIAIAHDVEGEVIARDEWQRVRSALAKLNPARRAALVAAMFADGSDRTPAAMRMMKMRARKQLRFLMEEAMKAKAGCLVVMQESWDAAVRGLGLRSHHAQHLAQMASAAVIAVTAGTLAMPSPDTPNVADTAGARSMIRSAVTGFASIERPDPSWEREMEQLAQLDRPTPKKARNHARKLIRVGPLSYGPGDSTGAGSVWFDPNDIARDAPVVDVSPNKLICRVTVLRNCKERQKH